MFSSDRNISCNISGDGGEFLKSRDFNGPDLFQSQIEHHHQSHGLARYRSAPSSFMAALLDSNTTDNSSSGDDESDAFFSALIDDDVPRHLNLQKSYSMKQEIGPPAEPETRPGYVGSYSVGMETQVDVRMGDGGGHCPNLLRQSSSPAGFFNGFGVMGEVNHNMSFSSGPPISSSRFMPTIPEHVNESIITTSTPENVRLKRNRDADQKMFHDFSGFENQNGESRKRSTGLVSHMSLPKTSSEMAVVENYLNFGQEMNGVPCQIRAKRGFATHPRSIAERMRRTRISDNMKKLQDLFPNMDKQTNTADMLDMAVEYIKDLQNQVQTLTEKKAKCVCVNNPRQTRPTT